MMKHRIVVVTLFALLMVEYAYADVADDLELARKFSPILILTEETGGKWGDISVTKPEPVEIVGADSSSNLWYIAKDLRGDRQTTSAPRRRYHPSPDESDIEAVCPHLDFSANQFAFLTDNCQISYNGIAEIGLDVLNPLPWGQQPTVPVNGFVAPGHFNYPGSTPALWDSVYFGKGAYARNDYMGSNFPNTAYVHIYKTTHEAYTDSITVIQYFYFYPYNHWWNNHEGDWQRIHVVVSSRNSATAEVIGVEYLFHGAHVSYYKDYPYNYNELGQTVENTGQYYPDLTTSFVFNPRENLKLSQGTHPIVYVGAGSHAAYPTGGNYIAYEFAPLGYSTPERITHTGLVLSTQADDSHYDLWESYDLVLLPDSLRHTAINRGLPASLSWLGADVLWGTPFVDGRGGNKSPQGPYHKGWEELGFFQESITGLNVPVIKDRIFHSVIPHTNYHHWAIIGNET